MANVRTLYVDLSTECGWRRRCVTKEHQNNNKGLPVARHVNKPDHIISYLECVMLKGDFSNSIDRLIEEQILIHKLKNHIHGYDQDLDFLAPYTYFHK